jgi:hypothetical protein
MEDNIILLRHYIFIDPHNLLNDINNNAILNDIKKIHKQNYTNKEIIKYYGYNDIVNLLKNYDNELCELFMELNPNYPALLADIGRLIILYNYGGIYHDLKCISNKKMINYLSFVSPEIQLIAEEHTKEYNRVRNTNIVALQKNSNFLRIVLQKIKIKLKNSKDAFGPKAMFNIGSGIYIEEFKKQGKYIYKYPFQANNMLKFFSKIKSKNIITWQNTYEHIFKGIPPS